jgi:hypothetical protein
MSNYLIALAIAGAMTVPATAQPAQTTPAPPPTNEAQAQAQAQAQPVQPVQPQMVKKTVCEDNDNPYSHISRICHTVMVPAQPAPRQQAQTPQQPSLGN